MELEAKGHHPVVGAEKKGQLLDELRVSPWEEVAARRFAHENPWLALDGAKWPFGYLPRMGSLSTSVHLMG